MEQITYRFQDVCQTITDYVANGSFKSLADNVQYSNDKDFARLIRLVDFNSNYDEKNAIWVPESSYKFLKKSVLYGNEVIISNVGANLGTVFKCPKLDYPMTLGPNSILIKTNDLCNQDYLYYYLKSRIGYNKVMALVSGSAMPKFNKTELRNMEVSLPNRNYQDKAAELLSKLDKKIELNNKINNNLYEFTNKLFEEKVLNNQDKDSWNKYKLSDISKVINGYSYKGSELIDKSDIGMTTIKNFDRTGGFKLDGFKDIIPKKCKIDHYVKPFEVLVACTDLTQNADIIGNAIMLLNNSDYKEVIMSMDLVKLVPTTKIVNNYMLYAIVNSRDFKDFALGYKSGTTVLHLNKNCFKEYTIKLPSEDLLKDLSGIIEINYKKISQIIEENRKLEQLRDVLLPKLMNGEIDLNNIED